MEVNSKLFTFAENWNWQVWTKVSLIKNNIRLDLRNRDKNLSPVKSAMATFEMWLEGFQKCANQHFVPFECIWKFEHINFFFFLASRVNLVSFSPYLKQRIMKHTQPWNHDKSTALLLMFCESVVQTVGQMIFSIFWRSISWEGGEIVLQGWISPHSECEISHEALRQVWNSWYFYFWKLSTTAFYMSNKSYNNILSGILITIIRSQVLNPLPSQNCKLITNVNIHCHRHTQFWMWKFRVFGVAANHLMF